MRALKTLLFAAVVGLVLNSCYKYPDVSITNEQLDMTVTIGDDTEDYTQFSTFTIEDTIRLVKIVNGDQVESDSILNNQDANHITGELRQKMEDILVGMHNDPEGKTLLKKGLISHFARPDDSNYDFIRQMEAAAYDHTEPGGEPEPPIMRILKPKFPGGGLISAAVSPQPDRS